MGILWTYRFFGWASYSEVTSVKLLRISLLFRSVRTPTLCGIIVRKVANLLEDFNKFYFIGS